MSASNLDPLEQAIGRLPEPELSPERRARLRGAVLDEVGKTPQRPVPRRRRSTAGLVAAAVLLLAGAGAGLRWSSRFVPASEEAGAPPKGAVAEGPHRAVRISGEGDFAIETLADGRIGQIRLEEGSLELEVEPLEGRAFRLVTSDAQIAVTSARFVVAVEQGNLSDVRVLAGRVEVARPQRASVWLERSERWSKPAPPAGRAEVSGSAATPALALAPPEWTGPPMALPLPPTAESPARADLESAPRLRRGSRGAPRPRRAVAARDNARPETTAEDLSEAGFRDGWLALVARDYEAAAAAFGRADTPDSPVASEACFWRAVSLARAGFDAPAEAALRRHATRFPDDERAEEVALLLGQRLEDRGDFDEARVWLSKAASSEDERIRSRARDLLEQISLLDPK